MIYFIQSGDFVKIGYCAGSPKARLSCLQVGNPERLKLVAALEGNREDEAWWHGRFAKDRERGEWFRLTPALQSAMKPHLTAATKDKMRRAAKIEVRKLFELPSEVIERRYRELMGDGGRA